MNMSQNCMNYIHFTQESVVGTYQWKGDIDLANIVLIGLAENLPEKEERYELHRLLGALLSAKLNVDEKFDIIGNEFDIPYGIYSFYIIIIGIYKFSTLL